MAICSEPGPSRTCYHSYEMKLIGLLPRKEGTTDNIDGL